ncbi:MAG: RNA polymerase sigma factor [Gaiellaceae bacterium]
MDAKADALERIYRTRYVSFRNGLAPIVGSYDEARDVVQEAFARALRSRADFRGEGSLQAWVWRIALRVAFDRRRRGSEATLELADVLEQLDPQLIEADRDQELSYALRRLPPRKRLVVFLRYFADLSYAEIAEVAGIAEGTVAATLSQARAALMEQLSMEGAQR